MCHKTSRKSTLKLIIQIHLSILMLCIFACSDLNDEQKYQTPYYEHFLPIRNYCGNTQNVHPKVLFFPDSLFGHRYWMCYSPYPKGNPKYENPCIAHSDDGIHWHNIDKNPLDVPQNTKLRYNSDPHLLYNKQTQQLELWFRYANEQSQEEIIYRMRSTDGANWTEKEMLLKNSGARNCALYLSPAAYFENGKYHIWSVSTKPYAINYYESTTGTDWQFVRRIELTYQYGEKSFRPWHIDVIHEDGIYLLTIMVKEISPGTTWCLFYSESEDNEHCSVPAIMLLPRANHWDEQLYRSSLVKTDQGYSLYYSARRDSKYGIGLCQAASPLAFILQQSQ